MSPDKTCFLCDDQYTKRGMSRHLRACRSDHVAGERDTLHLRVEGTHRPEFWIHIEAGANAELRSLDQFLRQLWLECCGHLSAFTIDGVRYRHDDGTVAAGPRARRPPLRCHR
jgi:hypothetical protein